MDSINSPTDRHQARKRFGQNFLQDGAVIDRIVRAIRPTGNHRFIEIGPGRGAFDLPIIEQLAEHATLDLLELDRDLAAQLMRANFLRIHGLSCIKSTPSTLTLSTSTTRRSSTKSVWQLTLQYFDPLDFSLTQAVQ